MDLLRSAFVISGSLELRLQAVSLDGVIFDMLQLVLVCMGGKMEMCLCCKAIHMADFFCGSFHDRSSNQI